MFKPVLLLALMLAGGVASAADPVTDAMQQTYGPYRVALYKTNSNAKDDARQALAQARQGWNQMATRYGAQPPAPYDRDPDFVSSVAEVSQVYAKAAAEIDQDQLKEAHNTLERAREVMADMRHRNQVNVYSDHMNAYHTQMEVVLLGGAQTLAGPNGLLELTAQVGALDYLAAKLKSEATPENLKNEEFLSLNQAVTQSVADLKAALFVQDADKVKAAISKLKGPYAKLFAKFG